MSATLKTTLARASDALDLIMANVNNNPAAGAVRIYTGVGPGSLGDAPTGTLLAECVHVDGTNDAFDPATTVAPIVAVGVTSGGVFAADSSINATGTAGYFRLVDSSGNAVLQGTCGTSGADLILDSVSFVMGGTVTINQFDVGIVAGV